MHDNAYIPSACGGVFCCVVMVYVIDCATCTPISIHNDTVRLFSGTEYTSNSNTGSGTIKEVENIIWYWIYYS